MSRELKKVIYVEDEPDLRIVAELALETVGGFEVMIFEAGVDAVREAPAFGPDMILLDVMMPGMDGPATMAAPRAIPELADVPIAFLTAKVMPAEVEHLKSLGAAAVIAKPFDPMTLADQVRAVWEAA